MSIIAAGTTTTTALSSTGNTDGTLQFQVNGTTASVTLNTLGAVGVGSSPSYGTSGQVLISGGSTTAPTWGTAGTSTTATNLAGGSNGTVPYQSASGTTQMLAVGSSGQVLTSNGAAAPSWSAVTVPSNSTLTNPTITNYTETAYTANSSTAITLALTNGTMQIITLTGICTVTMPTAAVGKSFILLLKTGSGGYTVTWSTVKWSGGTAPTLTSTASRMDIFSFFSDGTNWYGVVAGQNYTP